MAQFLALSILCCCAVIAVATCLRDAILAVRSKPGRPSSSESTDKEDREIVY